MSLPPCLMRMKVIDSSRHINLWIPLFFVWIILGALAIAISPLVAVLVLILWPFGWGEFLLMIGPVVYNCICSLRGFTIDIKKTDQVLLIYFR
jgi:hypothetical protein